MASETQALIKVAAPKVSAWVKNAVKADRANAYGLDAPWTLPRLGGDLNALGLVPPDFVGAGFVIAAGIVTELPFAPDPALCDGCTLAPDTWPETWGGVKAYVGAIFHDRWYLAMEEMARAWGWRVEDVRKLGDIIFGSILRSLARTLHGWEGFKAEIACRTYYRSVRAFGGVGHEAYKRFEGSKVRKFEGSALALAVAGSLALVGCAGCAVPCAWENPDATVEIPAHSYSNVVSGATWKYEPPDGGNDDAGCAGNDEGAE